MAVLLHLVPRTAEPDNVRALRELLEMAIAGRLMGASITYWERGCEEDHITTGLYRREPSHAIRAALRASLILTQLAEPERPK